MVTFLIGDPAIFEVDINLSWSLIALITDGRNKQFPTPPEKSVATLSMLAVDHRSKVTST